jgi:hypothetical protein
MSEPFQEPAPVSDYGRNRQAAWLEHLQVGADAMQAASIEAHRADHNVITAGQAGIFGTASPYDMAAEVAQRTARIGSGTSAPRDLVAQGGTFRWEDVSDSPAPMAHDMRFIDRPGQRATGKSPTRRWVEENR